MQKQAIIEFRTQVLVMHANTELTRNNEPTLTKFKERTGTGALFELNYIKSTCQFDGDRMARSVYTMREVSFNYIP